MDGVLRASDSNCDHGLNSTGRRLYGFSIGDNFNSFPAGPDMYIDYDDVAVSISGYIGP